MKTKILICILFLAIVDSSLLWAQNTTGVSDARLRHQSHSTITTKQAAKIPHKKAILKRDIRLGLDLSPLILGIITPKRIGLDISAETQITKRIYGIVELGYQQYEKKNSHLHYQAKGNYTRLGIDWNMRKPKTRNDEDILYIGARYAFSRFTQDIPFYSIQDNDWGDFEGHIDAEEANAHWVEAVIGFKVEVLKNVFLGLGARFKTLLYSSAKEIQPIVYIPGYARNYNTLVFNVNYNVYYNIPWNYKKHKIAVYE